MRSLTKNLIGRGVLVAALVAAGFSTARAQQAERAAKSDAPGQQIELGRGMSLVAPNLIEIAVRTNFFLDLADRVQMTDEQRSKLEGILYDFQQYSVEKQADYDVAQAELMRLVTRDTVNFDAVKAKVREIEALNSDVNVKKFESLLKAVRVLTHEQHMKIVTLARTLPQPRRPEAERIF